MSTAAKSAEFQSAPLTDVRGDMNTASDDVERRKFQSAPLTDVRGDCNAGYIQINLVDVSIRSPHGCKGRFCIFGHRLIEQSVSIRSPHGCKGR